MDNPVAGLGLSFIYTYEVRGRRHHHHLRSITADPAAVEREVTDANKDEFVHLLAAARATRSARRRLAMREGFRTSLPAEARAALRAEDLATVRSKPLPSILLKIL